MESGGVSLLVLHGPQTRPRDRSDEIRRRFESFVRDNEHRAASGGFTCSDNADSETTVDNNTIEPFTLSSLKSAKHGPSASAAVEYRDICGDIETVRNKVELYDNEEGRGGGDSDLPKIITEMCLKLKMKLDSQKFDEDYRNERRERLVEIDGILDLLRSKIQQQ